MQYMFGIVVWTKEFKLKLVLEQSKQYVSAQVSYVESNFFKKLVK